MNYRTNNGDLGETKTLVLFFYFIHLVYLTSIINVTTLYINLVFISV